MTGEDARVQLARDALAWYDRGEWTGANALNITGHLGAALRALLEYADSTVPASAVERAAQLAGAMTADVNATPPGDAAWTAQDVISLALTNGLADLKQRYGNGPGAPGVTPS